MYLIARDPSNRVKMNQKLIFGFLLPFVMMELKEFYLLVKMSYFSNEFANSWNCERTYKNILWSIKAFQKYFMVCQYMSEIFHDPCKNPLLSYMLNVPPLKHIFWSKYHLSDFLFFCWNEVNKKSLIKENTRFIVLKGILWAENMAETEAAVRRCFSK